MSVMMKLNPQPLFEVNTIFDNFYTFIYLFYYLKKQELEQAQDSFTEGGGGASKSRQ